MTSNLYFHPHFIIKWYVVRTLQKLTHAFTFKGNILDVGCGEKPYAFLFPLVTKYEGIDFKNYSKNTTFSSSKPDWYFSKEYEHTLRLPFKHASFEHTFSFQVMEHHPDPRKHISELVRVTKKKGTILLSVPFIWAIHEEPRDFFRVTEYALTKYFTENSCRVVYLERQGSIPSTIAMLCMDYALELKAKGGIHSLLGITLAAFFFVYSYCCLMFDRIIPSKKVFLNYVILAQKV